MGFGEVLVDQMNNPDCSMVTGIFLGEILIVRWLFYIFIMIMLYQAVNRLAWGPFLDWVKKKIYKKK